MGVRDGVEIDFAPWQADRQCEERILQRTPLGGLPKRTLVLVARVSQTQNRGLARAL